MYSKGKGPERENSPRCTNVGKMEPKTPQKKLAARDPRDSTTMETWGAIKKGIMMKKGVIAPMLTCVSENVNAW